MTEYITKQQAIDLAESLRTIAGNAVTDALIKGIEALKPKYKVPITWEGDPHEQKLRNTTSGNQRTGI